MTVPNWQHHSKKDAKRTLKPQAMRSARQRAKMLKLKLLLTSQSDGKKETLLSKQLEKDKKCTIRIF